MGVGADRFDLSPSGRTLTLSHDGSDLLTGSITVSSNTPVSAVVRFEASRHIEAGGRIAEFIEQFFPEADTTDFKGEISIQARAGQIAVIVLELEVGRAFTTLPVSPID